MLSPLVVASIARPLPTLVLSAPCISIFWLQLTKTRRQTILLNVLGQVVALNNLLLSDAKDNPFVLWQEVALKEETSSNGFGKHVGVGVEEQEEAEEEQEKELERQLTAHALPWTATLLSVAILLLCFRRQSVKLRKLTVESTKSI